MLFVQFRYIIIIIIITCNYIFWACKRVWFMRFSYSYKEPQYLQNKYCINYFKSIVTKSSLLNEVMVKYFFQRYSYTIYTHKFMQK